MDGLEVTVVDMVIDEDMVVVVDMVVDEDTANLSVITKEISYRDYILSHVFYNILPFFYVIYI